MLQNGTTFAPGVVNQAFHFDGMDDFIQVPNNDSLNPGTSDFTVDFWMKTTSSGVERAIINKRTFCTYSSFWNIAMTGPANNYQDGHLIFEINQDSHDNWMQVLSKVPVNDGDWHHIALVRQGATATAYIDKAIQGSVSINIVPSVVNDSDLLIGADICTRRLTYQGELDDIGYFNRALSQAEIKAMHDAGSAGKCTIAADRDGDRFTISQGDCNDADPAVSPGTAELCSDGIDNNCDGLIDATDPRCFSFQGLAAYYPFEGNALDGSDKGNNGSESGGVSYVAGINGQAARFDGIDDLITVANSTSFSSFNRAITVGFWMKLPAIPTPAGYEYYFLSKMEHSLSTTVQPAGFHMGLTTHNQADALFFRAMDYSFADQWIGASFPFSALPINQYFHVVFSYDGTSNRAYMNGQLIGTTTPPPGGIGNNNKDLLIGFGDWDQNSRHFRGDLDNLRIYDRALTDAEVAGMYSMEGVAYDGDGDGVNGPADCNDLNPAIKPGAVELCTDGVDNNCDGKVDAADPVCAPPPPGMACLYDAQCGPNEYCKKTEGDCNGVGACQQYSVLQCPAVVAPVCGCDGNDYTNACEADLRGVSVAASGACATAGYKWTYYFPAVKDNDAIGWENYLSVQAKDPVSMNVTIRAYDMNGVLKGTYIYSNATGANAPAIAPNARVAQRPSWIAGSQAIPVALEGSLVVETSVPAIASTNFIANFYKGFSIYEAAKVRPIHYFPKAFDGPNNFQVYMLVQNIYDTPRNVTVKLFGKNVGDPGDGMTRTVDIPAHGTLKVRPSEIAGGIDFNGSVVVYSNFNAPEDGLGLPIPAMCSYEAGAEALAIYESTARQPMLAFPVLKDGKFGGTLDYQNFLSVVNMNPQDATITVVLYNNAGIEEGRLANDVIPSGGKKTWRPGWIKGTMVAPADFEGSAVIISDKILVGQTNTIYPGTNKYGADGFDLIESAMPAATVFFPKAFDNLVGTGTGATHVIDNFVYVQNLGSIAKSVKIEQFNNNGSANGYAEVALAPNATHVFRPKDLVTDSTGAFRGSVRVTERLGRKITGAIKYEVHKTTSPTSGVEAMSIYRSMGM